jgi:transposase
MELTKVELYEAIRKDKGLLKKGIREIARERGVHRRTVRQALDSAIPPERKKPEREPPVLTRAMRQFVAEVLESDLKAPRKQRHTGRRLIERLRREHGFQGGESTVRKLVAGLRRSLDRGREAFVPLVHDAGQEAEVDWWEAVVEFPSGRAKVQVFQMRACASGREYHEAFPQQTQQAFLEGHVHSFEHFQGVFTTVRYDNLASAVQRVLRGRQRQETARFVALRSHYGFESEFCRPGQQGAHEKGGVEGGGGRFRRNHFVPVPKAADYGELNRQILSWCAEDDGRVITGKAQSVAEDWAEEAEVLSPVPKTMFPTAEAWTAGVDSKGQVLVRTNRYSVPIRLHGRSVEVRMHARTVECYKDGACVAKHLRLVGCNGVRLELDHYLELLKWKPGALSRSLPLRQAREQGRWPKEYDEFWSGLRLRYGDPTGTRQMLEVLLLHRRWPADRVLEAVRQGLACCCFDAGAVATLLRVGSAPNTAFVPLSNLGALSRFDRPVLSLADYDQLLPKQHLDAEVQ